MRLLPAYCVAGLLLLAGCDSRPAATATRPPQPPAAAPAPTSDTLDYTSTPPDYRTFRADSLIWLGRHRYWLQVQKKTDSTRAFDYGPTRIVGRHFAAPADSAWRQHRVRGYDGTYTITLRDSTRRRVIFQRQFHKKDLLRASPPELLTVSEPDFYYQGYSSGLNALLFTVETGIPDSDVGHRAALLLDARTGRLQALQDIGSASFDATDCDPQVSPDGRAVLTCADTLLRAGRPPLSLRRPHAELRAARFLTDTTLLVVYAFGDYRPTRPEAGDSAAGRASNPNDPTISAGFYLPGVEFVSTPTQQRATNAFVLGTSGRVLGQFFFANWGMGEMSYSLPRQFMAATRTYYFLNSRHELILLPKATPGRVIRLPVGKLPKFQLPQQPQEIRFTLPDEEGTEEFIFYVDKARPQVIRVQRRRLS